VADVTRGFHDVLTNAVGRFLYRNLILFSTGYARQLFEVDDEGANFCFAQGWWQHVLPPDVEPLQQHCLGFLCHGGYIGPAHFPTGRLHSRRDGHDGSRPDWVDDGVYFRGRALARLFVASLTSHAIQVRTMKGYYWRREAGR
jgi:hypothetical protein